MKKNHLILVEYSTKVGMNKFSNYYISLIKVILGKSFSSYGAGSPIFSFLLLLLLLKAEGGKGNKFNLNLIEGREEEEERSQPIEEESHD